MIIVQIAMWHETNHRAEVTVILQSPQKDAFAVGYADGSVRLWNASTGTVVTTFNGHTKAITSLMFDAAGAMLASGSQDTTIILWDIIGEVGLFRWHNNRFRSRYTNLWLHKGCVVIETKSPPFGSSMHTPQTYHLHLQRH
jgi:WD40 repeat protein